jgi:hypothetical protein
LPAQALEVSEDDLIAMLNSSQHIAQGRPEKKIQVHRQSAAEIFFTRTFDEAGQEQLLSMSALALSGHSKTVDQCRFWG